MPFKYELIDSKTNTLYVTFIKSHNSPVTVPCAMCEGARLILIYNREVSMTILPLISDASFLPRSEGRR